MVLLESWFRRKTIMDAEREKRYNSTMNQLEDIYEENEENLTDYKFSIFNKSKECMASVKGLLDPLDVQFLVQEIYVNPVYDELIMLKKLFKAVIDNLELNHPEIDIIYWEIRRNQYDKLQAAFDLSFDILETRRLTFNMVYHLTGKIRF